MRVCEVCGKEEAIETDENQEGHIRLLHICEDCQNDRVYNLFD